MKMKIVVVSTTLNAAQHKDVTILSSGVAETVTALKAESGKDIWLFGGGVLFRSLLDAGLVDSVELAVSPVLLGGGVRLLPEGRRWPLRLTDSRTMPKSGIVMLKYAARPLQMRSWAGRTNRSRRTHSPHRSRSDPAKRIRMTSESREQFPARKVHAF